MRRQTRSAGNTRLEGNCGALPAPVDGARCLANRQHLRRLCSTLVPHVSQPGDFRLADSAASSVGGRIRGSYLHHLPRLRTWFIFQIPDE